MSPQPISSAQSDFAPRTSPTKVAIAMSGGVDSSVAAALLLEQGHEVVGLHMKLADPQEGPARPRSCCALDDALDARQVAHRLGIPFYVLDFRALFAHQVVDNFVSEYQAGRTPNPCARCNQFVKNAALLAHARTLGCSHLATGHYAHIRIHPITGKSQLVRPADLSKDQTYFLFGTPAHEIDHLMFPLAGYTKPQARQQAGKMGLVTWDKPDSQDVCFVPGDYRDFLRQKTGTQIPGDIVDTQGRILGRHQGLAFYTIGQRKGLGLSAPEPLYVVRLDPERNQVVVGAELALMSNRIWVSGINWVSIPPPGDAISVTVKVRYSHAGEIATVHPTQDGLTCLDLAQPVRGVTPGQAAVFYDGDVLLGGGWIERAE